MKLFPLAAALLALAASAQTPAPPAPRPDARYTPRGTVFGFLEACEAGDYARASAYLNLSNWPPSRRERQGPELARQLKKVIDRKLTSSLVSLSADPAGSLIDGLPEDRELLGRASLDDRKVDLYLERVTIEGRQLWLFAGSTVALVPQLYEEIGNSTVEQNLPSVLVERTVFGAALWQWLALIILALASGAIARAIVWTALLLVKPLVRRTSTRIDDSLIEALGPPIRLLVGIVIFRIGLAWVVPPALLRAYLRRILGTLAFLAVAWFLSRLIDLGSRQFASAMARRANSSAVSVVPLARRSLKVVAFFGAALAALELWGFNTATLLTGLGIGGVAVALAAQKTIENLFGGVALITDQPVNVGDVCKFGDRVGTIEDIGLWSTRIRTPERTVVSVPNGQFSSMALENLVRRDQILFNHKLPLRRDTTTAQIRRLLTVIDGVLSAHPKAAPGAKRVRFRGVGPASLDLEVFAYVMTSNFDEFLTVQEELLLAMLERIEEAGTGLDIPAQLSIASPDPKKQSASTPQPPLEGAY